METINKFPEGAHLYIHVVFPGDFRIGWEYKSKSYHPGIGSYYPFDEAIKKAYKAFEREFNSEIERGARNAQIASQHIVNIGQYHRGISMTMQKGFNAMTVEQDSIQAIRKKVPKSPKT